MSSGFNNGQFNALKLQGVAVATTPPSAGQVLEYGGNWGPVTITPASINALSLQGIPIDSDAPVSPSWLQYDGTEWEVGTPPVGGSIIADAYYDPVGGDNNSSSSTTFAKCSGTHIEVAFNAPPSGIIWVYYGGFMKPSTSVGGGAGGLGIMEGASVLGVVFSGPKKPVPLRGQQKITGLVPGSAHTYDLGFVSGTLGQVVEWIAGGGDTFAGFGPSFLQVWG